MFVGNIGALSENCNAAHEHKVSNFVTDKSRWE